MSRAPFSFDLPFLVPVAAAGPRFLLKAKPCSLSSLSARALLHSSHRVCFARPTAVTYIVQSKILRNKKHSVRRRNEIFSRFATGLPQSLHFRFFPGTLPTASSLSCLSLWFFLGFNFTPPCFCAQVPHQRLRRSSGVPSVRSNI